MTAPNPVRLAWLDALRGFAALIVMCFHLSPLVLGSERHLAVMRHIDLGKYGVLLFFLVSGYVIPMSLEKHGSLRRFWIGRLCRIYPAYLFAIAVVAILCTVGLMSWQASIRQETVTAVLGHVTMLPDLLGERGAVRVFWTLSYEMTFYLVVSGLFAWRLHRHSDRWAAGLALVAFVAGRRLPDDLFGATFAERRCTAAILVVVIGISVVAYLKERFVLLAGLAGIAFLLLPALNGHATRNSTVIASWQGLLLLAVMFAGTVIYRWQHGELERLRAIFALTTVTLGVIGAHWTNLRSGAALALWSANVGAVAVTFLFAYTIRNRTIPGVLTWLGRISYSLYLLHAIVLSMVPRVIPDIGNAAGVFRVAVGFTYVIVALGVAHLAYRMVERPGQALGRKLTARLSPRPPLASLLATQRAVTATGQGENRRQSV
ncbi:acyltransferase [Paractinoplanes ferrugineus]|uniref:Acyltransferase n=1 Tax=Paractinoplanes ferrugineus TaxID=113564 RepID=A0A919ME25_9ACTN|nr:acyltransferase [Actinoplanes ferrugineus]GIE11194.1 acyltransferase [Actinoplanes ferrugineus]